jgi:two-component system sensor histidine kinase QseC
MIAPRTLRGRLAAAMLAIFVLAVAASALVNRLDRPAAGASAVETAAAEEEPYQDGLVLAGFCVPALLLIWGVSSWSLRPLARASAAARRIGPLAPGARLSRAGLPAEITPLVDAVNGALDRMAEAFEAERRFTENAAHELRTPLAVLGLRLQRARQAYEAGAPAAAAREAESRKAASREAASREVGPREVGAGLVDWAAIDRDVAQMNRLVSQLLDLARKEHAGRSAAFVEVNLSRIVREACAMVLPLAEAQARRCDVDLPAGLSVRGQPDDLRDAVRNLLENAVQHGSGTIGVHGARRDGGICLVVSDQGPGVPAAMREAVFERFRKDSASAGTGLGLAIVREVARVHGGRAGFLEGDGCRVEIWLPV